MQHNGNGSGPHCPKPDRLRELIDFLGELESQPNLILKPAELAAFRDIIDALDWTATTLENRSLYHKKQNLKKKVLFDLAREKGLLDEANSLTNDALHDYVSNSKPDRDDFELSLESDRR